MEEKRPNKAEPTPIWIDNTDVMNLLHISKGSLWRWRQKGILTGHRLPNSRRIYYDRRQIDAILQANIIQENHRLDKTALHP